MNTQNKIIFALNAFAVGEKEIFNKHFPSYDEFINYSGNGDKYTYLLPAFLYLDYWNKLVELGYPIKVILSANDDFPAWLLNEEICKKIIPYNKLIVQNFFSKDLTQLEYETYIDDTNWKISLDYFPMPMQDDLNLIKDKFFSDDGTEEILINAQNLLK